MASDASTATRVANLKHDVESAKQGVRDMRRQLKSADVVARGAAAAGGLIGGATGAGALGLASVGEAKDGNGYDLAAAPGILALGLSLFVGGAAGVMLAAGGGANIGSVLGAQMAMKRAGVYSEFRAATHGVRRAEEDAS